MQSRCIMNVAVKVYTTCIPVYLGEQQVKQKQTVNKLIERWPAPSCYFKIIFNLPAVRFEL